MTIPKAAKPWWPDRTVLENPGDPDDLSGRPFVLPQSEEEGVMNSAGGDDKGIVQPPPDAGIDPRFRVYEPDVVDEAANSDAGFTRISGQRPPAASLDGRAWHEAEDIFVQLSPQRRMEHAEAANEFRDLAAAEGDPSVAAHLRRLADKHRAFVNKP